MSLGAPGPRYSGVESEFRFEATRANWSRLMNHEVDPVRAVLDGTLRVKGNLGKLMRFTRASKELVETAAGSNRDRRGPTRGI